MKSRTILSVFVTIATIGLLLASCGTGNATQTTTPPTTTAPAKTTAAATTTPATQPPKTTVAASNPTYGGTLTVLWNSDPMGFDEAYTATMMCTTLKTTNEELMSGDWKRGLAGTGELDWFGGFGGRIDVEVPFLAESWEVKDDTTIIFHLRKGVKWAVNVDSAASKLVAGREVTAEDVAYSINRAWTTPTSFIVTSNPPQDRLVSVKATDKYTIECKVPAHVQGPVLFTTGDQIRVIPQEIVARYGDMKDWRNSVGTGPWMLIDYVPNSTITYARNPNYWGKDPLRPANQLPYADGVKALIISDLSTRLAAFRTGKIDTAPDMTLTYDDLQSLLANYKETQYTRASGSHYALWGREDKQELPFKDLRVRQALNMGVNKKALVDDYYKGHATIFAPIYPQTKSFAAFNTPFDQMPQEVKDLFTYNPEKAKQLLKEAGYPNGFKTKVACTTETADFLAIVVQDWSKIGVALELQPMETGVFNSVMRGRTFEQMLYKESVSRGFPYKMSEVRIESLDDVAYFESEKTREAYNEAGKWVGKDDAKWTKIIKDIYPYIVAQAPGVWLPVPEVYRVWQPWVKEYHGEYNIGYDNQYVYMQYIWIDRDLKKAKGF